MIRIAYAEDEAATAELLKDYLERYGKERSEEMILEYYENAEKLLFHFKPGYELLLLDIQLGGMNGYEAAERIRKQDSEVGIIFITSLVQYAVKGYEVDALDFIVKPVSYSQFSRKMDKALRHISRRKAYSLTVMTRQGTRIIRSNDLLYVEVSNHDLIYHTMNETLQARGSLSALEEKLKAHSFLRVSVSHLVNPDFLERIEGNAMILANSDTVWISRARKKEVMAAVAAYLGGSV
ncbi:MAG: response regulator transcription factor [Solobacterium sp.]|nr:response regulator transcription factor [Solobacterium sp.]